MSAAVALGVAPGRSDDDRTRIAAGVLLMLESLTRRAGKYLEALDYYRGELSGDADQAMAKLRGRSPAVLVTVGGSDPEPKSANKRSYLYRYQIEIAVISNHMQSLEAREVGGGDKFEENADPGVGKILHDIRGLLAGRKLNVAGCNTLIPEGESIIIDEPIVAFAARYSVGMAFTQPRSSDPTPNLAESSDTSATLIVEAEQ